MRMGAYTNLNCESFVLCLMHIAVSSRTVRVRKTRASSHSTPVPMVLQPAAILLHSFGGGRATKMTSLTGSTHSFCEEMRVYKVRSIVTLLSETQKIQIRILF